MAMQPMRGLAGLICLAAFGLGACAPLGVPAVRDGPAVPPATPSILDAFDGDAPVATSQDWRERRAPILRRAFARHLYGAFPDAPPATRADSRLIDAAAFHGAGRLEEWTVAFQRYADDETGGAFKLAVVTPNGASGPLPVIILQTFCGNRRALQRPELTSPFASEDEGPCAESFLTPLFLWIFGEHIMSPPIEMILEQGYALAFMYPGEIVPDVADAAHAAIELFRPPRGGVDESDADADLDPPGAIAAWAWGYSLAIDVLESDSRFDAERMALWGHSRNGKAAIVAAAFDPRADLVIAHQSGTGGATLTRSGAGESVAAITKSYPYWFNRKFASYRGRETEIPVDQHQLLGLVAPRPVLLGNSRRDVWSDPQGAFAAAAGADPVYELFGAAGLDQAALRPTNFAADLAFYMRGGRHGVTGEDWDAFLQFLNIHFAAAAAR